MSGVCPVCGREGRFLEASSQQSDVDYFRCDGCGHVWSLNRKNPKSPPRDVTERTPQGRDRSLRAKDS